MKFFLFRKEVVSLFSETKSNTGDGISVFGVPADSIANMTATVGAVHLLFKDAGAYDNFSGATQEGLEKVRVSVSCTEGEEFELIREIMEFIASDSKKSVMVMDAVSGFSTFNRASDGAVLATIPAQPVILATGDSAQNPASTEKTGTSTTLIAGVTFPSQTQRPSIDFNSQSLSAAADGARVGSSVTWTNSGTDGSTFDIDGNTNDPLLRPTSTVNLAERAVEFANNQAAHLAAAKTVEGDYTMYMVYSDNQVRSVNQIYGSSATTSKGFGNGTTEDTMFFTFDGNTGDPAALSLDTTEFNTKQIKIQDPKLDDVSSVGAASAGAQICYVWVIRRDKDFNIIVHDYKGDVVGYLPAKVGGEASDPGRTDGDLTIDRLGGDGSNTLWVGNIARFGVIETDIGRSQAARIARELFDTYNAFVF
tara:strand:- start:74 stop:1339 length:1266 start_codon:yes stop_codon:yes gene_type:complete